MSLSVPTDGRTQRRPMIPEDMYALRSIVDFAIRPGDGAVVCVLSWLDHASDRELSALALRTPEGLIRLTEGSTQAEQPSFSGDGRYLAYLARGTGAASADRVPNVWRLDFADLAVPPARVTNSTEWVTEFAWSPTGDGIAYAAKPPRAPRRSSAVVCTTMRYKNFIEGWLDERTRQLWLQPLDGGAARQLTQAGAEFSDISFDGAGERLLCRSVRLREDGRFGTYDLHLVDLRSGEMRDLGLPPGVAFAASFSPDGRRIAFIGSLGESADGSLNRTLFVQPLDGGIPTDVLQDWDRTAINCLLNETRPHTPVRAPRWSADGRTIQFIGTAEGAVNAYAVDAAGGRARLLTDGRHEVVTARAAPDGSLIALITAPTEPGDLWRYTDGRSERLTTINAAALARLALGEPEQVTFASPHDGREILGWVVKPADFSPDRLYPLVVRIAGGPYLAYGESFVDEVQTLVGAEFVVFYCNPHGSQSFGQDFASSVVGDWFGKDVADILAGVDHVVSLGYVDPARLGLVGASYGGTLINWIVGHDRRFAAAVSQRALGNLHSGFATSEWGWTNSMMFQFGGVNAFDDPMHYLTRSPVWYVNRMETPILFLQAGQDTLTPIEQVEQIYVGLKLRGVPTEMVIYPEEQHYVRRYGKPSNRVDYSQRVIAWLDRYMNGSA